MKPVEKVRYCLIQAFKLLYEKEATVRYLLDDISENFEEFITRQIEDSLPELPLPTGFKWIGHTFVCNVVFLKMIAKRGLDEFIDSLISSTTDAFTKQELREMKIFSSDIADWAATVTVIKKAH